MCPSTAEYKTDEEKSFSGMMLIVLVPLLPLLTAIIVLVAEPDRQYERARLGVLPLAAAFVGSLMTLAVVASHGTITIRLYDPSSIANLALPLGFHIDRLSAVMMTLISAGRHPHLSLFQRVTCFRISGYRRYLGAPGHYDLRAAVHGFERQSGHAVCVLAADLVTLYLYAGAQPRACRHARRRDITFTLLRLGDIAFLAGIVLAHSLFGTVEFHNPIRAGGGRPQ